MTDRRQIVDLFHRGDAVALVTLVRVEGSSYRRPGARLLIAANGDYAGAISGGCLEAEVIRKAQWAVRAGAVVQRYSTLFDDTADIPFGLGCGGTVDLLLEPANTPEFHALMQAFESSLHGETHHILTTLPTAQTPLRRTITAGSSQPLSPVTQQLSTIFEETIEPPQRLILFGAGNDAQPMVKLAALMGWNVTVIDSRPQWTRPDRFPEAADVMALDFLSSSDGAHAPREASSLKGHGFSRAINLPGREGVSTPGVCLPEITSRDAVVLMAHSYEQDRAWLTAVLPRSPRYLGLLGARHRSALLVSEAAALLGWTVDRACERVFAPLGLDLGGDGAEAIALATVAEIQACCEGKLPHSRRLTPATVADQIAQGGASRYLQTECAL